MVSEQPGNYDAVLEDPKIRTSTLKLYSDGYTPPEPTEVRLLIAYAGSRVGKSKLTGGEIANIVGVKDSRTVRRWTADENVKGHQEIPYAAWRLLLQYAGLVEGEMP